MPTPGNTTMSDTATTPSSRRSLLRATAVQRVVDSDAAADGYVQGLCGQLFLGGIERDGLRHVVSAEVERRGRTLGDLSAFGRVELSWTVDDGQDVVLALPGGELVLLVAARGTCEIVVAGRDPARVAAESARLADALREEVPKPTELRVRFWTRAERPYAERRRLDAPEWDEIADNYPPPVRAALGALVAARVPGSGSVVLWHGPPGGGKTTALRALARAWGDWCSMHYITDPELFLRGSDYLMSVAAEEDGDGWRLIVLEDSGELMHAGARAELGQGLSRVLNLTDGLLGQGRRCLLLVTTNEPVGRLHPALRRPGRCWAEVEFTPFTPAEAAAWLAAHGIDRPPPASATTLAELYALADDRELPPAPEAAFGFARGLLG
jgi:hypothetical protein